MHRIICIVNQKGGVGKTTTVLNIGAGLARAGKKVLLIDLDPQANLTYATGHAEPEKTIYDLIKGTAEPDAVIIKGDYDLIPANIDLSAADLELAGVAAREWLLKEAIEPLMNSYDYIIIDTPPALNVLTLNALTAAQEVFVTLQTEALALNGVKQLMKTVEMIQKRINHGLKITGIIATLYDRRKISNKEVIEIIKGHFSSLLFNTYIRDNVALAEAPNYGQDIFAYKPECYGAKDYATLVDEIIKQEGK